MTTRIDETITKVQIWGYNKGILKADLKPAEQYKLARTQLSKTLEEIAELAQALNLEDAEDTQDAYGDIMVTLIMGMEALHISPEAALEGVYNIISKRTGKTTNGIFVKDA